MKFSGYIYLFNCVLSNQCPMLTLICSVCMAHFLEESMREKLSSFIMVVPCLNPFCVYKDPRLNCELIKVS